MPRAKRTERPQTCAWCGSTAAPVKDEPPTNYVICASCLAERMAALPVVVAR